MSQMTTNETSDDTLIRDSQLTGFHLFKERIGSCCCRVFKKSSNYNLSSISKDIQQQEDKPSYVNQAFQKDKKQRKDKLDQIAKSLPTTNIQPANRNLNTKTQLTPRSAQTPSSNVFQPKTPLSSLNQRQVKDETSTDDSTEEEEEEEEEEDNSSDSSDSSKKRPVKSANKKR